MSNKVDYITLINDFWINMISSNNISSQLLPSVGKNLETLKHVLFRIEAYRISDLDKEDLQKGDYLKLGEKMIVLNLTHGCGGESFIFAFIDDNMFKIWTMYSIPPNNGVGANSLQILNSVIKNSNANIKIYAVSVLKSAMRFWEKMKRQDLIADFTCKNY